MSLSGARGLTRVAKNPGCELQVAMAVERVNEPEFYQLLAGEPFPGEYGERVAARRRGTKFEANLHQNDAALLREVVGELYGLDPLEMWVRNFELEVPGLTGRDVIRAPRLQRTLNILRDLAAGKPVPDLIIQPQLRISIGTGARDFVYITPDFMVLHPHTRMYVPGEEKSFIVRNGEASPGDLDPTRHQAAAEIIALRSVAARACLDDRVANTAVFVFATPYGLKPAPAFEESLHGEVAQIERAVTRVAAAVQRVRRLRAADGATLDKLAYDLPINYQEGCVGSCLLASLCRERSAGQARELGDAASRRFGPDSDVGRIVALLGGAEPASQDEVELAAAARECARILGLDRRTA